MNKKMHALGVAIIAAIVYLLVFTRYSYLFSITKQRRSFNRKIVNTAAI